MAISYKNTGSSEHENEEVKTTGSLLAPPIMPDRLITIALIVSPDWYPGHHAAQTA